MSAPARPLPSPILNLPHHRSPFLVFILDRFYHVVRWFVVAILVGAVLYGAIGAFLVTGQSGVANPLTWPSVQLLLAYPGWSLGIGVPLLLFTGLGWTAHLTGLAHPQAAVPVPATDGPSTIPVKSLRLGDFKLGPNPNPTYFERAVFTQARETIRAVVAGTASGRIGLVVFGAPMVGKTRLALEALRREAGDFQLLVWPRAGATLSPAALARFQGQRVALLLDDLHEFARQNEAGRILDAVTKLRGVCKSLLVVATSRAGSDQDAVTRDFGGLLELLTRIEMQPMVKGSGEADGFLETMREAGAELHTGSFDGTPGSALLDLDRRTDQLRDPTYPRAALATLKALALLRHAYTYEYPEERVRRVAVGVFGLGEGKSAWEDARDYLVKNDWLRLGATDASGQSALRLPTDAYLDTCVAAIYPVAGRRVEDDFEALRTTLSASPADSDALFNLAEALREDPLGDKGAQGEMALACVQTGLSALDPQRQPKDWARGQVTLGNMYLDRIRGERADNLEHAIAAYEAALTIYTRDAFPAAWAQTQNNLGVVYADRIRGERADNLEMAIRCYEEALIVRTRESFPADWAATLNNLGEACRQRIYGDQADNLERAITAYGAALTVYTQDTFPVDWARTQLNLGNAYLYRIHDERADNLEAAIRCYEEALTVLTRQSFPGDGAQTQNNLGEVYRQRIYGERVENLQASVRCFEQALTIYTRDAFPASWAMTTYNVGLLQEDLAEEAGKRGDLAARQEHLKAALETMRSTLSVYTVDGFPADHADSMRAIERIEAKLHEAEA